MDQTKRYWETTNQLIPIETREIINDFLLSYKQANKAEATIIKYRRVLEKFFIDCSLPLKSLNHDEVLTWLNAFSAHKKERTVDLYLSALSSFFKFCLAEDYMDKKVIKNRWRPKIPQSLPKFLDQHEYVRVKVAAEKLSVRDRALIQFLFDTGCRKSEVINLTIKDVVMKKRTAIVRGKGGKIRHVHFTEECALLLMEYLNTRSGDGSEPLFLNKFGGGLKATGIAGVVKKVGKIAGLKQQLFPHCCRHTFATNMLAKGADLQFIAGEMGHEDLNTTRIYARVPTEDLINAYHNKMG